MNGATRSGDRISQSEQHRKWNSEFLLWLWVRVSGLLLVFLALSHFVLTHFIFDVAETGVSFVTNRWQRVGWRVFDWTLLTLALTHGANGVRVVLGDLITNERVRRWMVRASVAICMAFLLLGTFTIVTFRAP